jgi:ATP-dependent exoDNAse (exonuclease V) beta subunit
MSNLLLFPGLHTEPQRAQIRDAAAREEALDITRSFLVEAPAGSGKTGLLIQRFLKLLAAVDDPRSILAITFTRKATSEMQERVLAQLAAAAANMPPEKDFDRLTRPLAVAVLARDAQLGWNLLDNPARLNIRTIDGISQAIAGALPVLSGSGGAQSPSDDPGPLYTEAARRTLLQLGGTDEALSSALEIVLLHRDGDLANCEALIASMLKTRDQWGELVPLSRPALDDSYLDQTVLPALDKALDRAICRSLSRLSAAIPTGVLRSLSELAAEMALNEGYRGNASPIALCQGWTMPPEEKTAHLDHWRALLHLLVTKDGSVRSGKGIKINTVGFRVDPHQRAELVRILDVIRDNEPLRERLHSVRSLPPGEYPREQWPVTKALFRVLARALAELKVIFAERGQCDFAEIALLARDALRSDAALDDLSTSTGLRLEHLLVDEMQDTSTGQYEFLQLLTRRWDGHSQTVFLVGDPKQSIYLFRQARVERFVQTMHAARLGDLPLTVLRLTANFRSQPALVEAFNRDFTRIFPAASDPNQPELVPYTPVHPVRSGGGARTWHANPIAYGGDTQAPRTQAVQHAREIRALIHGAAGKTVAILVRGRTHLAHILAALKQSPAIPYRALDIEPLGERAEILDLLALTRALLHPADRTAWLALLRSPVCGLSLADLHALAGDQDRRDSEKTIFELLSTRGAELSADGIARLEPFWAIMDASLRQRGLGPVSQWVERTWHAFGVAEYSSAEALQNSERFFKLLDDLAAALEPGASLPLSRLQQKVDELYAATSAAPDAVDLITMHGAKGLEWDVVILPELHRTGNKNKGELLEWLEGSPEERPDEPDDETVAAGILAPISGKGKKTDELLAWMRSIREARETAERKRLFYVACTRAREQLHLFAAPRIKKDGSFSVPSDTLLRAAWPAAEPHFDASNVVAFPQPAEAPTLAIAAGAAPRMIQRMPHLSGAASRAVSPAEVGSHQPQSFDRAEAGFATRAFGNTLHAFLEQLATRRAAGAEAAALLAELPTWQRRIAAILRANGLAPGDLARLTAEVLRGLTRTLNHAEGQWVLAPHTGAASEGSLSTREGTIRLDRIFRAGAVPLAPGADYVWIVDYKTTSHGGGHGSGSLANFLEKERARHAPQLEAYAAQVASERPVRLALYYPMLPELIWWELVLPP